MYARNETDRLKARGEALLYFRGNLWDFPSINARQLVTGGGTRVKNNNRLHSFPTCYGFIHLAALLCITLHNVFGATLEPITWTQNLIPVMESRYYMFERFNLLRSDHA